MMARSLKSVGKLGAKLPFGPLNKEEALPRDIDVLPVDEQYCILMTRMEAELGSLYPHEELEGGRANGPSLYGKVLWLSVMVG